MSKQKAFLILSIACGSIFLLAALGGAQKLKTKNDFESFKGYLESHRIEKWWESFGNNEFRTRYLLVMRFREHAEVFKYNFDFKKEKDSVYLADNQNITLTIEKGIIGSSKNIWAKEIYTESKKLGNLEAEFKEKKIAKRVAFIVAIVTGLGTYLLAKRWRLEKKLALNSAMQLDTRKNINHNH